MMWTCMTWFVHIQYMNMCIYNIHYHALLIWACQSPMWCENYESQEDTIQWLKCLTRLEFVFESFECVVLIFFETNLAKNDVLPEALPPFRHVSFADLESSWRKVRACHAKELETGKPTENENEKCIKTWKKTQGERNAYKCCTCKFAGAYEIWNVSN